MSDLAGVLTQIRRGITRNAYPNETAVRTQIVQRILHELGWNVFDPDKVCNEFSLKLETKTRRIDLALCVSNRNPRCIIELKSTDYDLKQIGRSDGDKQLFQYAFHAGAPVALLTNGVGWRFYSTYGAGTYANVWSGLWTSKRDRWRGLLRYLTAIAPTRIPNRGRQLTTQLRISMTESVVTRPGRRFRARGRVWSVRILMSGWWLLTHMSNKQKIRSLSIACEVVGIAFGERSGLYIDLPNA